MVKIKQKQTPSNAGWCWLPASAASRVLGRCVSFSKQLVIWVEVARPQMGRNGGRGGWGWQEDKGDEAAKRSVVGYETWKLRCRLSVVCHAARQRPRQQLCRLKTALLGAAYCLNSASWVTLGHGTGVRAVHTRWARLSLPQTSLASQRPQAEHMDLHHLFHCPGPHSAFSPSTEYAKTAKTAQGHVAMTFSMSPKANISVAEGASLLWPGSHRDSFAQG